MTISQNVLDQVVSSLVPTSAFIVGWFLNMLTQRWRVRLEEKRVIGAVLADLLDIRHTLIGTMSVPKMIGSILNAPQDVMTALSGVVSGLIGQIGDLQSVARRYEEGVTKLSHVNPILAFRLRNQSQIHQIKSYLETIAQGDAQAMAFFEGIQNTVVLPGFLKNLEQLIRTLSRLHGWWTWFRVRRLLGRDPLSDPELLQYMSGIRELLEKHRSEVAASAKGAEGS